MSTETKINANYDQFIGYYPKFFTDEHCDTYVKWWDMVQSVRMTQAISKSIDAYQRDLNPRWRKDNQLEFPHDMVLIDEDFHAELHNGPLWEGLTIAYEDYANEYNISEELRSYCWKMHKVLPKQGYHHWHHEHGAEDPTRVLVWMIMIHPADEGGETEFLHQSKRMKLAKGDLIIWPAGFTHAHRGSPPLEGWKMYITGWFKVLSARF